MANTVDDEIVSMKFDNSQFERGVTTSLSTLDKLKQALTFKGGSKGLQDIQNQAGKMNLNPVTAGIEGLSKSWMAMSTIAITALATITTKAIQAGAQIASSLTIDPIKQGFQEYETNIGSIQTILANTQQSGAGLKDVNRTLDELNHYADKTIYNFSEMARNIGTFTAAGVDLKTSAASIKGIANLAAMSGSNSQQASSAMYQLSQAISAGRVSLQDWNSVVNAGMGGTAFQRALAQTAEKMGTLDEGAVKLSGKMKNATINGQSFRESITAKPGEESWLTSKVLTETLKQFTGDMTDAELAAQGFTKEQIKAIQAQAETAQKAATEVKTLSGVMETAKEAAGSGWAKTFQIVFGNFNEAKSLFTDVSETVNGFISGQADARNKMLKEWKKGGGREMLIDSLGDSFQILVKLMGTVKDAWRSVFPAATGDTLLNLTRAFDGLVERLQPSEKTLENLKRTFAGAFAILHIGVQVVVAIAKAIGSLFGEVGKGSGGFFEFTGSIGDMLVAFDAWLEKTGVIEGFFQTLANVIKIPLALLGAIGSLFGSMFSSFNGGEAERATGAFDAVGKRLETLTNVGERFAGVGEAIGNAFGGLYDKLQPVFTKIGELFGQTFDKLVEAFSGGNFDQVIDIINTGLLGGIALLIGNFFKKGLNINFGGGALDGITDVFGELSGTMKAMQNNLNANTLLQIAGAIGILTASVVALSLIDSAKLTKALAAMAVGFGQLLGTFAALQAVSGVMGTLKIPVIAAGFVLLGGAMLIFALALKAMSMLDYSEMLKGLVGIAGSLVVVGAAMRLMPANLPITAAGLVLVGAGLLAISGAMKVMATLKWEDLGKGLAGFAGALVIIAGAMQLMPPTLPITAAGLILVGNALVILGGALRIMGGMSWEEIGRGLVTLAGALAILAGGLTLMSGTLGGSAALAIAAAALAVLVPVLTTLGGLDWGTLLSGLAKLAVIFAVLGAAGLLLAPVVLPMMGLGAALLLFGAGFALAGAGALAFATAFGILVGAMGVGVGVVSAMLNMVIGAIPRVMEAIAKGIIAFAKTIFEGIPQFVKAFSAILESLLRAVIKNIPLIEKAFGRLLDAGIRTIRKYFPRLVSLGVDMLVKLIQGITNAVPRVAKAITDFILALLRAIAKNYPRLIDGGFKALIKLMDGITKAVDDNSAELGRAGGRMAAALIRGLVTGIASGAWEVASQVRDMAGDAIKAGLDKFKIFSPSRVFRYQGEMVAKGLAGGVNDNARLATKAVEDMATDTIWVMTRTMSRMNDQMTSLSDFNPTITPVLDLTQVAKEAAKINGMVAPRTISVQTSRTNVNDVNARRTANAQAVSAPAGEGAWLGPVEFTQNNYSPKYMSAIETYRGTKSLLSMAKEAVRV